MNRVKRSIMACMPMILLTAVLLTAQVAQAAGLTCGAWSVVTSPSPGGRYNRLLGVASVSASDVWAVGESDSRACASQTLTEQWNGTSWSVVPSPNVGNPCIANQLNAVAVGSANNIWAVGWYVGNSGPLQTLTEHWNGTSWSVVPSPNVGMGTNVLNAVSVISPSNVWAVGDYPNSSGVLQTLIEHWDGTSWSVVASPSPGSYSNYLYGVTAVSASNVWAVGTYANPKTGLNPQTLIEQWNGTSWKIIPSANAGRPVFVPNVLNAVKAITASNIWAVGYYENSTISRDQTLIEHWNGTKWSLVSSPNAQTNTGPSHNILLGIAVVSTTDIWTAGYFEPRMNQTLTEHWNGTKWSLVSSPNVGTGDNILYGVAAADTSHIWAAGYNQGGIPPEQTLTEFYC